MNSSSAESPAAPVRLLPEIDPAFQRAVDAGLLTIPAAIQRGDREVFALRLVRRHGLSARLAYQVADNRISLGEAIRRKPAAAVLPQPVPRRPAASPAQMLVIVGLASVGLAFATWNVGRRYFVQRPEVSRSELARASASVHVTDPPRAPEPAAPASPRASSTLARIARDASGQIIEIAGPDPRNVLMAYCDAAPSGPRSIPLEITETVPRLGDARLGRFQSPQPGQAPQAIWIRKDWQTRRWIAGDGKGPIPVREAPEMPDGALRWPVDPP